MDGKPIVDRIISDATEKCNEITERAQKDLDMLMFESSNWVDSYKAKQKEEFDRRIAELQANSKVLTNIECMKIKTQYERDIVDILKKKTLEEILNSDKDTLARFAERLLEKYAEDGDEVICNMGIDQSEVEKMRVFKDRNLKIQKVLVDESDYGIKLSNKICDKNLSFELLIEEYFNKNEKEILKEIFGN